MPASVCPLLTVARPRSVTKKGAASPNEAPQAIYQAKSINIDQQDHRPMPTIANPTHTPGNILTPYPQQTSVALRGPHSSSVLKCRKNERTHTIHCLHPRNNTPRCHAKHRNRPLRSVPSLQTSRLLSHPHNVFKYSSNAFFCSGVSVVVPNSCPQLLSPDVRWSHPVVFSV